MADGSQTQFSVPFPYISKSHVKVYVNGSQKTFDWVDDSTVELSSAPTIFSIVEIKRSSNPDGRLVDFIQRSTLRASDLDKDSTQQIYLNQENGDVLGTALKKDHIGNYNANGLLIKNVGNPSDAQDIATKYYVDGEIIDAEEAQTYLDSARAARDKAQLWAEEDEDVEVESGAYSALHHKEKAQTAAATASSHRTWARKWAEEDEDVEVTAGNYSSHHHANKAEASATNAADSEANASNYATYANWYATDAVNARDKAQDWAEESEDVEVETGAYSAKHHAAKASTSAANAGVSEENANMYASDAASYRDTTEVYKNKSLDYRDDAHQWAEEAEDTQFTDSDGTTGYSAKHRANKAEASATDASNSASTAASYESDYQQYRDEAFAWAEEAEDVSVSDSAGHSGYSSFHHAQKAEASASAAATSESNAATSESNAATSESNAADSESAALGYRDDAYEWAQQDEDVSVLDGTHSSGYSAYHHAQKAAASESAAATSESNAANSADAAATSESNAATSESNAATYESDAEAHMNDASWYSNRSNEWAEKAEDTEVATGQYSAYHWAQKAQAYGVPIEFVRLRKSSDQSLPNASWTNISWESVDFDTEGSAADLTNNQVVVPSGYNYAEIYGAVRLNSGTNGSEVSIYLTQGYAGDEYRTVTNYKVIPDTQVRFQIFSGIIDVADGDRLLMKVYHNSGASATCYQSEATRLDVKLYNK